MTIAIIQARMSSKRLPEKTMLPLAGKPVIWHIVDRLKYCKLVSQIVVATSNHETDDPLADYCISNNIQVFRGSLNNVLSRFLAVLDLFPSDYFVRVTGDCPLIDPEFIDDQISFLSAVDGDSLWLSAYNNILAGQGVLSRRAINRISKNSNDPRDLEHVGSEYLANNPSKFRIFRTTPPDLTGPDRRLCIDDERDYQVMKSVYQNLWNGSPIELMEALSWLDDHPSIAKISASVEESAINRDISKAKSCATSDLIQNVAWDQIRKHRSVK